MPYVSRAQQGYIHAAEERGEIDPDVVKEFDEASRGQHDLPYHVKKKAVSPSEYDDATDSYPDSPNGPAYPKKKRVKKSVVLVPFDKGQESFNFDEEDHPRAAAGSPKGGQFVKKEEAPSGPLFHDSYTGPRHTYGLTNRPPGYSHIPEGWIVGSEKPHADYRHGTVDYPRELTQQEQRSFELEKVHPYEEGGLSVKDMRHAGAFLEDMQRTGWTGKEKGELDALQAAYDAGPRALADFLRATQESNDFSYTLAPHVVLPILTKSQKGTPMILVPLDKGGLVPDLHGRMVPDDSLVNRCPHCGSVMAMSTRDITPTDESHDAQGGPHEGFPPNPPPIPHGLRPRRRVRNPQGGEPKVMVPMGKAIPGKKKSGHKTAPKGYPGERKEYADPKNFKYPLDTEKHVHAANSYLSQEDNQSEYSPEELKTMFARIHRAGKRLGIQFEDMEKDLSVTPAGPSL